MQQGIHHSQVTHGPGAAELIMRGQRGDCIGRHLRLQAHLVEIISRRKRGKQKRKNGDTDQEKRCLQQSAQKVTHHTTCGRCAAAPSLGVAAIKRRVVSCPGSRKTLSAAPSSTIFPRSITAISSARCPAIAKSWVLKRYVKPN